MTKKQLKDIIELLPLDECQRKSVSEGIAKIDDKTAEQMATKLEKNLGKLPDAISELNASISEAMKAKITAEHIDTLLHKKQVAAILSRKLSKPTILLNKDDSSALSGVGVVSESLTQDNQLDIAECTTSENALDEIKRDLPDAILLDIEKQDADIDGIEIYKRLKIEPVTRDIPIIAVSKHISHILYKKAVSAGVPIIHSPMDGIETFLNLIKNKGIPKLKAGDETENKNKIATK